jgi:hypothetical protein
MRRASACACRTVSDVVRRHTDAQKGADSMHNLLDPTLPPMGFRYSLWKTRAAALVGNSQ